MSTFVTSTPPGSVALPAHATFLQIMRHFSLILGGVLTFGLATGGLFPLIGIRLYENGATDLVSSA